ncbi:MAG: hypothetical protein U0V72_08565 [Cytophagales bacterium]
MNDIEIYDSEQKKLFLLLEALVFHYHDLDKFEIELLNETAKNLDAYQELDWAINFIKKDRSTSFERVREYLLKNMPEIAYEQKSRYIIKIWNATNKKGYVTEMEALALIKIAKDLGVENDLIKHIRKK